MKKRLNRPRVTIRYPDDVARLVTVANDAGYEIDAAAAQWAWEQHSLRDMATALGYRLVWGTEEETKQAYQDGEA